MVLANAIDTGLLRHFGACTAREVVVRRAAKVDGNHRAIVSALRAVGCKVLSLAPLGRGAPDILVLGKKWAGGQWTAGNPAENSIKRRDLFLLEIKNGAKPKSARKLTPDEARFHDEWYGTVNVVNNVAEALAACGFETTPKGE